MSKMCSRISLWGSILLLSVVINFKNGTAQASKPNLDVPFEPTHPQVVDAMLDLAQTTRDDILYDLGCGDGRILIRAAEKFGVHGIGVDIDPQRIKEANENAANTGTTEKVSFTVGNIMNFDFSAATVVTLYLLERINIELRPMLLQQLKPGTRVVSHAFDMGVWEPDSVVYHPRARRKKLFLWVIPTAVGGDWNWTTKIPEEEVLWNLQLNQEFQGVTYNLNLPKYSVNSVGEANLRGQRLRFVTKLNIDEKPVEIVYSGTVQGNQIRGTQKWMNGQWAGIYPWTAVQKPVSLSGTWRGKSTLLRDSVSEFELNVQQSDQSNRQLVYISNGHRISDFPYYIWGANIWYEIHGLTFKGFVRGDSITGLMKSEEMTTSLNWSAQRLP